MVRNLLKYLILCCLTVTGIIIFALPSYADYSLTELRIAATISLEAGGSGGARFQKKMAALVGTLANGLFLIVTMGAGATVSAAAAHSQRVRTMVEKAQKAKAKIDKAKRKMNQLAGRQNPEQGQAEEGGKV